MPRHFAKWIVDGVQWATQKQAYRSSYTLLGHELVFRSKNVESPSTAQQLPQRAYADPSDSARSIKQALTSSETRCPIPFIIYCLYVLYAARSSQIAGGLAPGCFPYLQRNKSSRTGPDDKRHNDPFTCELACATFVSPHLKLAGRFYISAIWPSPVSNLSTHSTMASFLSNSNRRPSASDPSKAAISGCRGTIGNAGAEVECSVSPLGAEYNKPTGGKVGSFRNTRSFGISVSLERGGHG